MAENARESGTPEADAAWERALSIGQYGELPILARKLECERDAARAALAEARELLRGVSALCSPYGMARLTVEQIRDIRAFLSRTEPQDDGGSK